MPKKHRDLFDGIASFQALIQAAQKAVLGKRRKPGAAAFIANLEREVLQLESHLREGRYRPGRYTVIQIKDPKPRMVSAAPFRDRPTLVPRRPGGRFVALLCEFLTIIWMAMARRTLSSVGVVTASS